MPTVGSFALDVKGNFRAVALREPKSQVTMGAKWSTANTQSRGTGRFLLNLPRGTGPGDDVLDVLDGGFRCTRFTARNPGEPDRVV